MANPFSKGWKYLMASFDSKIDENADPKVQIQQATAAAKEQHQQITQQAAAVIGNQKQLEMKLDRLLKSQQEQQERARTAIQAADKAAAEGDADGARELNNTAEIFASQLVAVEQQLEETKQLHAQATQNAEQAQRQQKESELRLQEQLGQIDQLRAQADQAAMQETSTKAMDSMQELRPDDSVPTLDAVREKIERRYADALGAQELTQSSVHDRISEIAAAGTDMKASARLAEIRAAMSADSPADRQLTEGVGGPEPEIVETESEDTEPVETGKGSENAAGETGGVKK
ncbi:PspA/IM30 family protein [Corynebacterium sp. YIM 101645]|uniref:PspA/IM30 family protein n=1 Tax=Corynebacterium lemuris TaxID=1859292 RepID=A0ABT2FZE4_9CORY|nr:PspA/IM30 family protein [Corynebacterium lemuris]MCS5480110.1 PspA/IM30 family protein [Corynebacterium lemuris]